MAVRTLPVIQERPRTVGDCREGYRPCPYVSCRFNLLVDVLDDGGLVLNVRSQRLSGAERVIPDAVDRDRSWWVLVEISNHAGSRRGHGPQKFAIGPCGDAASAKRIKDAWDAEFGRGKAQCSRKIPDGWELQKPPPGAYEAKFLDEAEDAIESWFDEPDPDLPSCVLDEVGRVNRDNPDDDAKLLEEIARILHVSRERVRQIEGSATEKFTSALRGAGLSMDDLKEG